MAQARSGAITVATAGTAVQGPGFPRAGAAGSDKLLGFYLRADPANSGANVYVGNDGAGDVSSANGFALSGTAMIYVEVNSLDALWFDADTSGDKIQWILAQGA